MSYSRVVAWRLGAAACLACMTAASLPCRGRAMLHQCVFCMHGPAGMRYWGPQYHAPQDTSQF